MVSLSFSVSRKWQLENAELEMVDGDVVTCESVALTGQGRPSASEETYLMERAKETAETSHISTSEQEETSNYVITGNYHLHLIPSLLNEEITHFKKTAGMSKAAHFPP